VNVRATTAPTYVHLGVHGRHAALWHTPPAIAAAKLDDSNVPLKQMALRCGLWQLLNMGGAEVDRWL